MRAKESEKGLGPKIFEHGFVPKHEVLDKREVEGLIRSLHIKPHQLPYIKATDPAATAIGAKPGDVVRVLRRSPTAGAVVVYRYVIEG